MDIADIANDRAEFFRNNALNAAKQNDPAEPALYIDGEKCCIDCEMPIPAKRLVANPDAVRCIACQEAEERLWTA